DLQNKLNNEKSRLAAAVQACEAATASISRPSSPLETAIQAIPERELIVRAKLEDLLDQMPSNQEALHSSNIAAKAVSDVELQEINNAPHDPAAQERLNRKLSRSNSERVIKLNTLITKVSLLPRD
ncbi:uncharacterized protein LOC118757043, partial [Rhagoletis pomonella]|uniref:uncharacterized protein LOC118757043 n=1 Tax=Rhagoletis pomonella TaxID=28610 RepID=UPI00177BC202